MPVSAVIQHEFFVRSVPTASVQWPDIYQSGCTHAPSLLTTKFHLIPTKNVVANFVYCLEHLALLQL
jgi:hypothetical protein